MKKLFIKIKNRYLDLSLQSKLLTTYLIIISIPMIVIAIFFYGQVYNMILSDTIRNEQEDSAQAVPALEDVMTKVLETSNDIQDLSFYTAMTRIPNTNTFEGLMQSYSAEEFAEQVNYEMNKSIIKHVRFYIDLPGDQMNYLNQASEGLFEPVSEVQTTYWRGIFAGTGLSSLHCPSFYLSSKEIEKYGDMAYISRKSLDLGGETYTCYAAYYYSSDLLLKILNDNLPANSSVSYIINDRDAIIATTNPALSSTYYLNYASIQESFMSSNSFLKREIMKEDIYAGMYNIKQSQWYMVVVIPSAPLVAQSRILMFLYIFLYLACILVALLIAVVLSRSITRRIAMVTTQMAKVRTGPPIPLKESDTHDEIGDLIDTYNYMSTEMNTLLKERAKSAEELRIAEFNSLQAQINPHFLYNTMDMINWMAAQGRTSEIVYAVQNLSKFYKLTLSKKETISTIAEEVEHASIYIRLQNMRYHDRITFVVDIPDELLDYQIPKLTLQPVIENAVLHGIMEKQEKQGSIVLTGWLNEDQIELLVSDDGIGISQEKLNRILRGDGISKKGSNIAIYNTHHRLQVLYGDAYGLSYESQPGKGTDVSILLPAKKKSESFSSDNIIQISHNDIFHTADDNVVVPEILLDFNERISNDTYVLQNIHQISNKLPAEEPMYILSHNVVEDFPTHTHQYFELVYCCRGSIINCIDNQELVQSVGDLIILNPSAVQSIRKREEDTLLINIILWPEYLDTTMKSFLEKQNILVDFFRTYPAPETNYIYFPLGHNLQLQTLLSSIIKEYAAANFRVSRKLTAMMIEFLTQLTAANEYSRYGLNPEAYKTVQYIKNNCFRKDIRKLAARFQHTPESLSQYLRKYSGRYLKDIIDDTKISHAIELLQRPDLNIYDIIDSCGYENAEVFFKHFEEVFHISPDRYRKEFL